MLVIGKWGMLDSAKETTVKFASALAAILLSGCAGAMGDISSTDPTERGLSYVAAALDALDRKRNFNWQDSMFPKIDKKFVLPDD